MIPSTLSLQPSTKHRPPTWHEEAKAVLQQNFSAVHSALVDATKRAAWLGLFLNYIKARGKQDGSIPHGTFRKWLNKNLPDLGYTQVAVYMTIGRGIAERLEFNQANIRKADIYLRGELPKKVVSFIADKTQNQLYLEFKQSKIQDDQVVPARGRIKGSDGNPRHKRDAFEARNAEEQREVDEQLCHKMGAWLKAIANDSRAGHPEFCPDALAVLHAGVESFSSYLRSKKPAKQVAL